MRMLSPASASAGIAMLSAPEQPLPMMTSAAVSGAAFVEYRLAIASRDSGQPVDGAYPLYRFDLTALIRLSTATSGMSRLPKTVSNKAAQQREQQFGKETRVAS